MSSVHAKAATRPRLFIVEDNPERIAIFQDHLKDSGFILIIVRSGGQALGVLGKDGTEVIAGVLLDHDLSDSTITEHDASLSTSNIIPLLIGRLRKSVPILIHSHNVSKPAIMQRALESSGFSVTRIRFDHLTPALLTKWLQEVVDNWET